jgi:hypothetical protein
VLLTLVALALAWLAYKTITRPSSEAAETKPAEGADKPAEPPPSDTPPSDKPSA